MAKIFVPATVANVGPGFDVLGFSVTGLGDTMTGTLSHEPAAIKAVRGVDYANIPLDPMKNCASIAAAAYLTAKGSSKNLTLEIDRQIPLSGGLGSSAAASVGGAMLAAECLGEPYTPQDIMSAALAGEAAVAGRHLDNIAACVLGEVIVVRDNETVDVVRLGSPAELFVTVVTPDMKLDTKKSRAVLPPQLPTTTWTKQMANCTAVAAAILTKDWPLLQRSFEDHFAEPGRAGLIPNFKEVKEAALAAGAIGCSISGGGPSIFAISLQQKIAEQCRDEMRTAFSNPPRLCHVGKIGVKGAHVL